MLYKCPEVVIPFIKFNIFKQGCFKHHNINFGRYSRIVGAYTQGARIPL